MRTLKRYLFLAVVVPSVLGMAPAVVRALRALVGH